MADTPGQFVDVHVGGLDALGPSPPDTVDLSTSKSANERGRPWIGIHFECCGVYTRVYREPDARRYEARCPRCARPLSIAVGPDGVNARIFRARPT